MFKLQAIDFTTFYLFTFWQLTII